MSIIRRNKMHNKRINIYRLLLIGLLVAFVMTLASLAIVKSNHNRSIDSQAFAEENSVTVTSLADAEAKLNAAQNEYNAAKAQSDSLQAQIEETTQKAVQAQNDMFESRNSFNKITCLEYKEGPSLPFLTFILDAKDFDSLLKSISYANKILEEKNIALNKHAEAKSQFDNILIDLNKKADAYNESLSKANAQLVQIQAVVDSAKATLAAEEAAQIERKASGGGSTPTPAPDPGPDDPTGWQVGMASAYGGSSDPGSGSRTATGEIVDDFSMGVAVPMSWPNYRSLFGHSIQIRMGGTVVIAKINDCGYMGGGSRSLDLQPGVFKAFGYGSCQAWGVRQVEYKIL
ncbi:MAG: hypothetical protein Q4E88_04760 [Coriobacteriia bacterium]|nr:hypothetical protein [Coriobacteriia bacterium]